MGETRIIDTFVLSSRGMLMVKLPADSAAADEIPIGGTVALSVDGQTTLSMRLAGIELALPVTGPPCDTLLGLVPLAGQPLDLDGIGDQIAGHPEGQIVLRWDLPPSSDIAAP